MNTKKSRYAPTNERNNRLYKVREINDLSNPFRGFENVERSVDTDHRSTQAMEHSVTLAANSSRWDLRGVIRLVRFVVA